MQPDIAQNADPVRVFVAGTRAEWLPMRVLEFSIRETSGLPVQFAAIHTFNRAIPMPVLLANRPRTPFSFQRFLIPELCGFAGRAIYLDADMQVFVDIGRLWQRDFNGCSLQTVREGERGRRGQFSVMLLDCRALGWNVDHIVAELDAGRLDYAGLMYEMRVAPRVGFDVPPEWNSLEHFEAGQTCLLHYTDMNTQPWISTVNPLGHLWVSCLRRALAAGFITRDELEREVRDGHVRPSLLLQIDAGIDDTLALSRLQRASDRRFVAPYRRLHTGRSSPWTSPLAALRAFARRCYFSSPLAHLFGRR